jgi:alginate O-acetyltransferase complex protein AlgI
MIFDRFSFLIFFIIFFGLYWNVFNKTIKMQNLLILEGSYVFYAFADWRFLFYLIGVSAFNFWLGMAMERSKKNSRLLLWLGLLQGIGGLAFVKYFNFFISSFVDLFAMVHITLNLQLINIMIPLGISFFTFRTLSYLSDIDKGKIKATTDWVNFFTYVAFFPTLISGPIDKSRTFMPQLEKARVFDYNLAADGMRQILWGLFKKVVVANNCAKIVNDTFMDYQHLSGSTLLYGTFFYAIQIYADFSGYSDMAIGISKLLGFRVTKNFDYPFFAQNIAEYWRKWHMSLTSWLTEYVFTPLSISFRDWGKAGLCLAIIINFTIVGIWHGANMTYVLFGFLHGCYFIPLILNGTMNKKKKLIKGNVVPSLRELFNIIRTFILVMLTFVVFRADTMSQAFDYYRHLFSSSLFSMPDSLNRFALFASLLMLGIEWLGRDGEYALADFQIKWPKTMRWGIYYVIIFAIFYYAGSEQQFIYFQF